MSQLSCLANLLSVSTRGSQQVTARYQCRGIDIEQEGTTQGAFDLISNIISDHSGDGVSFKLSDQNGWGLLEKKIYRKSLFKINNNPINY
jgi:hypothetical protein